MSNDTRVRRLQHRLRAAVESRAAASVPTTVDALGELVRELKAPVAALAEEVDPECGSELRAGWAELEFLYALRSAEGQTALSPADRGDVDEGLRRLSAAAGDPSCRALAPAGRGVQPAPRG